MSRRLALMATVVLACGGHVASTTSPGSGSEPTGSPVAPPVVATPAADAAPPRPLDQDLPRLAARAVALLTAIQAALDGAHDDCAAATARLGELAGTYADLIAANAEIVRQDRKDELARALAPQQAALDAAGAAVFRSHTLAACAQVPEFKAAFDHALGAP